MKLNQREQERGWVIHSCPAHGDLVVGPITFTVACKCRKKARANINGIPVSRQDRARMKASRKALQNKG